MRQVPNNFAFWPYSIPIFAICNNRLSILNPAKSPLRVGFQCEESA